MNDQPKPTGEWTARTVIDMIAKDSNAEWNVADAHNAALDAAVHGARAQWDDDRIKGATRGALKGAEMLRRIKDLERQLAAEREKVQTYEGALKDIRVGAPDIVKQQIKDALQRCKNDFGSTMR